MSLFSHKSVQMKKDSIIFNVRNKQGDYAESMTILEFLFNNRKSFCGSKNVDIYSLKNFHEQCSNFTEAAKIETIADMINKNEIENISLCNFSLKNKDHSIWFKVRCNNNDDDIVNLQYFFLIKQWLIEKNKYDAKEIYLYIKAKDDKDSRIVNALYFKASHFLLYVGKSNCYADYVDNNIKKVIRLSSKTEMSLKKFTPLSEIKTSTEIGIEYWQQSMESFLTRCKKIDILWEDIIPTVVLNADKNNAERKRQDNSQNTAEIQNEIIEINQVIQRQRKKASENDHYRLLWTMKDLFCTKSVKVARKRCGFINADSFFDSIKNMSVLSFYLLCLFEYHSDLKKNYSEDPSCLYRIVLRMRDLCEGFGQLMENTIEHSDYGRGYFFIRIHDRKNEAYLKSKYKKYIEANPLNDKNLLYLEMQISDYSSLNVPDKFMNNIDKRKETSGDDDKLKYEDLLNHCNEISLSTFFDPSDAEVGFWEKYYRISDNIVYHYGLQMFDSVVRSAGGCFLAISSAKCKLENTKKTVYCSFSKDLETEYANTLHIPGTQYSVLFPLGYYEEVEYTAVNADIDYTNLLKEEFNPIQLELTDSKIDEERRNFVGQGSLEEIKKKVIVSLSDKLKQSNLKVEEKAVYYIILPADEENTRNVEIFCKVLIRFVTCYLKNSNAYIALLNCSDKFLIEMTRMLTVFYNKWGQSQLLKDLQIYLSGRNPEQSFLFGGQNVASILNRAEKMAIARGVQIGCIDIITDMLQRKSQVQEINGDEIFSVVPFELLCYGSNIRLFQNIVANILQTNICSMPTGCKIENTHVRLGSKVHLNEFYQVELLFQNNYFTTRFAYLVVDDIYKTMSNLSNIVLVGYETYSEMLIYEIKDLLMRKYNIKANYIIYEQKDGERFRYFESLDKSCTYNCIFIVPINSTLTTHNKIQASLRLLSSKNGVNFVTAGNYAILLLCPKEKKGKFDKEDIQSEYGWEEIDDEKVISELVENKEVRYFFRQDIKWFDAIECEYCFPKKENYIQERPLIETNKASIIPMQKLELNDNFHVSHLSPEDSDNLRKVEDLSNFLVYSHLERNGNHFNYYFQMGNFFAHNRNKIEEWLKKCRITRHDGENRIIFDIIVAPQHYSNNGFVEEVNKCVFHNASLVLDIEVNKEFRSNVKAKYSSLLLLYDNLNKCARKAELCFHYVDDTIISGMTFYRTKSLIRSIFPEKIDGCVKVTIFESVFLLLNRASSYSKLNYNQENYFAYVDLKISSMRTQEDACVLCNIVKEAKKMKILSATVAMTKYWELREQHHKCYNTKNAPENVYSNENREKGRRRMLCAHTANVVLNGKITGRNDPNEIRQCIVSKLLLYPSKDVKVRFEWELSYLKVLSRPFFSFSVVIRQAIFEILLVLLDYLLGNAGLRQEYRDMNGVFADIEKLIENKKFSLLYVLLFTLIKRLADLGSTFIIRQENIERILRFYNKIKSGDANQQFQLEYRACIKKLTSTSGDEIRSTWLEYLLINGYEYNNEEEKSCLNEDIKKFYRLIYMENTSVFRDAINDLTKDQHIILKGKVEKQEEIVIEDIKIKDSYGKVKNNYYLKNFKKIYDWNFAEGKNQNKEILDNICCLYNYLIYGTYINKDIVRYYTQLTKILAQMTTSEQVQIILPNSNDRFYVIGDSLREQPSDLNGEFGKVLNQICIYEDDTYFLDNERVVILKFSGDTKETAENCIYFGFLFPQEKESIKERYIRNVLVFRNEITQKLNEDFATNAIQRFLISSNQNKILADSRAYDHSYAKTRQAFLERARDISSQWNIFYNNDDKTKDIKDQTGFLYSVVANTIISRLFQKAVTGKFDGKEDWRAYTEIYFNTTVLAELELFNLYDKNESGKGEEFIPLKVKIMGDQKLDDYYSYESGHFTLSAIFLLLMINAVNHSKKNTYEETDTDKATALEIKISIEKEKSQIVFSNLWDEKNPDDKIEIILNNIKQSNYDRKHGITLWTLNKYFLYITRNCGGAETGISVWCSKEENRTYFNVGLPILVERN